MFLGRILVPGANRGIMISGPSSTLTWTIRLILDSGVGFSVLRALATGTPPNPYLLASRKAENEKAAIKEPRKLDLQALVDMV